MRYALVRNHEIIEFRDYAPNIDQSGLAPGKPRMLPVEVIADPYDPVTEVQEGPSYVFEDERVVELFTSRPKNGDEVAQMIRGKDAAIEREFARRCNLPIAFDVGGITYQFHADAEALENIQGTLNMFTEADRMGEPLADPRTWKPKGGAPITISRDEIAGLGIAIGQRKDALFAIKVPKQMALAVMTDPAAIHAVDPNAGWDIA